MGTEPVPEGHLPDKMSPDSGEVSEWLKEHAWKVCIRL